MYFISASMHGHAWQVEETVHGLTQSGIQVPIRLVGISWHQEQSFLRQSLPSNWTSSKLQNQ